jgi:hypothetical protein
MKANLICCTTVMLREIADKKMTQKDVALTFAMALKSEAAGADKVDWDKVGGAAIERWSRSGWTRIKERGWAIAEGRIKL